MTKNCPYCGKLLDIPDGFKSGRYDCPYDGCSKTFFYNSEESTVSPVEESTGDEIIVICPNPNCKTRLRIQKSINTLQITCPKCHIVFNNPVTIKGKNDVTSGLLSEFNQALEDEIKALKTRGSDISLVLKDGKYIGDIAGEGIYQFDLERRIPVADETPAQIEIIGCTYRATIVRFLEFKLDVRICSFDEEHIPSALLKIDTTYVLRKLKEILSSTDYRCCDTNLALKAFNIIPPKCKQGNSTFTLIDNSGHPPDSFQVDAIKSCIGNDISYIHGPPGTGKTRTLVNVVNDLANNGEKVLVTCHTNIACDNFIEHLLGYKHEPTVSILLNKGNIIRIGTPVLKNPEVKSLTLDNVYAGLSKKLLEEKETLSDSMNSLIIENKRYYEYEQIFLECKIDEENIANCENNITSSQGYINRCIQEEIDLNRMLAQQQYLLRVAKNRNMIINFFKKTMPKDLSSVINNLNSERIVKVVNRTKEESHLELLSDELKKLRTNYHVKAKDLPDGIEIGQINNLLRETEVALTETKDKIADIDNRIAELNEGVLNNAKIIVSTLAKTFTDPHLINMKFDVVAIDEASIAPLPMLFYVFTLAKKKILIFGDPKQLSPIKLATTPIVERWLGKDIFQEAYSGTDDGKDKRIKSLKNNYRMHREIFNIVNSNFYLGDLHDRRPNIDTEYHKFNTLNPKKEKRVVIIDTSNANACMGREKVGPKSWSRYNLYHIQILENILHELMGNNSLKQEEIGVITPYKSQASFIRVLLNELNLTDIDIGTVHSFQGIEKKCIVFDLVEAPYGKAVGVLINDKHNMYMGRNSDTNNALRLLTVAFSRPREKLLLISHNQHLLSKLPHNSVVRRIITDLVKNNAVIDGASRVPFYVPKDEGSDYIHIKKEDLKGSEVILNQRSFYPYLIQDLKLAKKEVIIISGYIYGNRLEKLFPSFVDLIARKVKIKIITKPPMEQLSRERELTQLHNRLRDMGIEIYPLYGTHEKIVAIDGHILYEGSLNVLSFNHMSTEMMTRQDSKMKLEKVFEILSKGRPVLLDSLSKTDYITVEQPIQDILNTIRPKHKTLPKTKQDAKDYYRSMLKKLRWIIADDKRIPIMAILYNNTIEAMLDNPAIGIKQILLLPEFKRNRSNIRGYENIITNIMHEYREAIGKCRIQGRLFSSMN